VFVETTHSPPTMSTATTTKACADCVHWKAGASGEGECRRHAPQLISFEVDDDVSIQSRFPTTSSNDWCGDFEPE